MFHVCFFTAYSDQTVTRTDQLLKNTGPTAAEKRQKSCTSLVLPSAPVGHAKNSFQFFKLKLEKQCKSYFSYSPQPKDDWDSHLDCNLQTSSTIPLQIKIESISDRLCIFSWTWGRKHVALWSAYVMKSHFQWICVYFVLGMSVGI